MTRKQVKLFDPNDRSMTTDFCKITADKLTANQLSINLNQPNVGS